MLYEMDTHKRFTKMEAIVHNFQKLSFTTASIIFNDCFITMNYILYKHTSTASMLPHSWHQLYSYANKQCSRSFLKFIFSISFTRITFAIFHKISCMSKKKNLYPFSLLAVHLHINLLCSLPRLIHISKYVKIFMKKINFSK